MRFADTNQWRIHAPYEGQHDFDCHWIYRNTPLIEYPFPTLLQLTCRSMMAQSNEDLPRNFYRWERRQIRRANGGKDAYDVQSFRQSFDKLLWPQFYMNNQDDYDPEDRFDPISLVLERRSLYDTDQFLKEPVRCCLFKWRVVYIDSKAAYKGVYSDHVGVIVTMYDLNSYCWRSDHQRIVITSSRTKHLIKRFEQDWDDLAKGYGIVWRNQTDLNLILPEVESPGGPEPLDHEVVGQMEDEEEALGWRPAPEPEVVEPVACMQPQEEEKVNEHPLKTPRL